MAGNQALNSNGFTNNSGTTDNHITVRGSDWYFTVCAVMIVSTFAFIGLSFRKARPQRVFHYITAAITMVAAIAYFCMGANLGWAAIQVEFQRSSHLVAGTQRQIFYVRYIDWVITTPLLLLDLLLTAGLPSPTILYVILVNEIMIITGLIGALVTSTYKWGFFTFGCAAFLFVAWTIVFEGRAYARALGPVVSRAYTVCGVWTIFLWFLYPIAWGLSEGGNVIASDSEAIFYGILDILAKPGFGALLLWGHRNINPADLGIVIRDVSDAPARTAHHTEKSSVQNDYGTPANAGAVNNGATTGPTSTTPGTTTGISPNTTAGTATGPSPA